MKPVVVLYGHLLDGNLKSFFEYANKKINLSYDVYYLTIDKTNYRKLIITQKNKILLATKLSDIIKVLDVHILIIRIIYL